LDDRLFDFMLADIQLIDFRLKYFLLFIAFLMNMVGSCAFVSTQMEYQLGAMEIKLNFPSLAFTIKSDF